jgi:hypothetical protein
VYGIVKIVVTALGLMFATEQMGRKVCSYVFFSECSLTFLVAILPIYLIPKLNDYVVYRLISCSGAF